MVRRRAATRGHGRSGRGSGHRRGNRYPARQTRIKAVPSIISLSCRTDEPLRVGVNQPRRREATQESPTWHV